MTTGQWIGLVGGIVGGILGVAGGVIGSYFSIKNTGGPCERAFMIKACAVCWVAILLFVGLRLGLPNPYQHFMWIPFSILLPLGIVVVNKKQRQIAQQESQNHTSDGIRQPADGSPKPSR